MEYKGITYAGIKFTTKEINMHFLIRIQGKIAGRRINKLVGVSGLIATIGHVDTTNTLLTRAMNSRADLIVCKLRRGIKITFLRH